MTQGVKLKLEYSCYTLMFLYPFDFHTRSRNRNRVPQVSHPLRVTFSNRTRNVHMHTPHPAPKVPKFKADRALLQTHTDEIRAGHACRKRGLAL